MRYPVFILLLAALVAGCSQEPAPESARVRACKMVAGGLVVSPRSIDYEKIQTGNGAVVLGFYASNRFGAEERHSLFCIFDELEGKLTFAVLEFDGLLLPEPHHDRANIELRRQGF